MKNRRLWLLVGGIILVLVLAVTPLMTGCAKPAEEVKPPVEEKPPEAIEVVYATIVPERSTSYYSSGLWMDAVEEQTNGRVHFTRYHSGQLFDSSGLLTGIASGLCDFTWVHGGINPAELGYLLSIGLPLQADDLGVLAIAVTEMVRTDPLLIEEATKNNIFYMGCGGVSRRQLCTTEKAITSLEDIKGLKIYAIGPFALIIGGLGGIPTTLSTTELYEAAERGTVDGLILTVSDIDGFRLFEVSKYFTEMGLGTYSNCAFSANLDTWNSLPEDVQKVMLDCVIPYKMKGLLEAVAEQDEESVKIFREAGIIMSTVPSGDLQKIGAFAPAITDMYVNLVPEDAEARGELLARFLAVVAKTSVPEWTYEPRIYFK